VLINSIFASLKMVLSLMDAAPLPCPVCLAPQTRQFARIDARDYRACAICDSRFLNPVHYPARDVEHAEYRLHDNRLDDPCYRQFLSRLATPLLGKLVPAAVGLDYGCGPGPALAVCLREAGHEMALYDPLFVPDISVLTRTYDFVTCTEVVEHFHAPAAEFARLRALVRPGGWLAIMTCFQTDDARFADWHYRKDITHVVFYRETTFRYLAHSWGWTCEVPHKDVVLMQRPLGAP
jgi:SAM-dependent methyltransferase